MSLKDYLRQAGSVIIALLTNPPSTSALDPKAGDPTYNSLLQLATIFQTAEQIPSLPEKNSSVSPLLPRVTKNIQEPRVDKKTQEPRVHNNLYKPTLLQKSNQHKWQRQ